MKNGATYFKYSVLLIIVLALLWVFKCGKSAGGKSGTDTVSVKIDTVFVKTTDTILFDNPIPYKVTYYKEKVLHDTLETIETILQHVDSAKILQKYLARRSYDTTINVNYGKLRVRAQVTQNRVTNARFDLTQDIPKVKETITLTSPKRAILYFGIQAIGNQQNLPYASGITIDLKLKNDAMIGGGAYLTRNDFMYSAALKFPIRFRKK